jgi:regulator of protease activity HflC (stomatin/prohibitin superfamily)
MKPITIIGAICAFFVLTLLLVVGFGSWGTINPGQRGVVINMGKVTGEIKGEGFYTKTPWFETVQVINTQVQKAEVSTDAASKDLQTVTVELALNVNIQPSKVAYVWQTYGADAYNVFVDPALKESMKAIIAQYTAEELITQRETVRQAISNLVKSKLEPAGFESDAINITNFEFSQTFNQAIEAKVTAQQQALAAQNKLAQVQFEAQQAQAAAQGKAEAITIESKALQSNPQILQLRAIEKWNGQLPAVLGSGAIPFFDASKEVQLNK